MFQSTTSQKPKSIFDTFMAPKSGDTIASSAPGLGVPGAAAVVAPAAGDIPLQPSAPMPELSPMEPNIEKPQGILGKLGGFLSSDEGRAALFRSGAATLKDGIGAGLTAGAEYIDGQKQQRRDDARYAQDFGLRERGVVNQEKGTNANIRQDDYRLKQTDRSIDNNYDLGILGNTTAQRGQDLNFKSNVMSNETSRRGQDIGLVDNREDRSFRGRENAADRGVTMRGQDGQILQSQITAASRDGRNQPEPKDALAVMEELAPGLAAEAGVDPQEWADALKSNPQLYSGIIDNAMQGYQTGGMTGAMTGAKGILDRYDYSPGFWGITSPSFNAKQPEYIPPTTQPLSPTAPRAPKPSGAKGGGWNESTTISAPPPRSFGEHLGDAISDQVTHYSPVAMAARWARAHTPQAEDYGARRSLEIASEAKAKGGSQAYTATGPNGEKVAWNGERWVEQ